jgi:hypothetical protein
MSTEAEDVAAAQLAAISEWIDSSYSPDLNPEAHMWRRVTKAGEEHGEVINALGGVLGENPRKGVFGSWSDVVAELLDEAVAALGAVEHITGNAGEAMWMLTRKIGDVHRRAGLPAVEIAEAGR